MCFDSECRGFRSEPVHLPAECCLVESSRVRRMHAASPKSIVTQANDLSSVVPNNGIAVEIAALSGVTSGHADVCWIEGDERISLHQRCDEMKKVLESSTT